MPNSPSKFVDPSGYQKVTWKSRTAQISRSSRRRRVAPRDGCHWICMDAKSRAIQALDLLHLITRSASVRNLPNVVLPIPACSHASVLQIPYALGHPTHQLDRSHVTLTIVFCNPPYTKLLCRACIGISEALPQHTASMHWVRQEYINFPPSKSRGNYRTRDGSHTVPTLSSTYYKTRYTIHISFRPSCMLSTSMDEHSPNCADQLHPTVPPSFNSLILSGSEANSSSPSLPMAAVCSGGRELSTRRPPSKNSRSDS